MRSRDVRAEQTERYRQAGALCANCPVRLECQAWADADKSYEGVAGGRVWFVENSRRQSRPVPPRRGSELVNA